MKKIDRSARALSGRCLAALLFCVLLLAACGGTAGTGSAGPGQSGPAGGGENDAKSGSGAGTGQNAVRTLCRLVDGAGGDTLVLAAQDEAGEVYTLAPQGVPVTLDGRPAQPDELRDGMLVTVVWDGCAETVWPARFGEVYALEAKSEDADDRCGLILEVFEDLWQEDTGLNGEINILGFDIDAALLPLNSERMAVAWVFSCRHGTGAEFVMGTWQQLVDEGYIDGEDLYWKDGLLFCFSGAEDGAETEEKLFFNAQKWRSGLGALFFLNCTADRDRSGGWSYEPGGFAIS